MCQLAGISSTVTAPGPADISLGERVRYANEIHEDARNCIFLSIHANAAGNGLDWHPADGARFFHHPASFKGRKLAEQFRKDYHNMVSGVSRDDINDGKIKESYFAVLDKTKMPAMLGECGFMTNEAEARYMASERGQIEISCSYFLTIQRLERYGI
jgi:N-acetylmuramoyl-L-alanine amidase